MMNWLQRLLYPLGECPTCDVLKVQLGIEQNRNKLLLESIINPVTSDTSVTDIGPQMPITPKHIPWAMQQQKLEAESRAEAQRIGAEQAAKANEILTNKQKEIQNLEKEVGIKEA